MIPKEKAKELYNKFAATLPDAVENDKETIIQCALIAVDEILQHCYQVMKPFWEEVKQEIEKL